MKYFKTFEKYRYGVNGVGSLRNSLAALKRQNINGRYVDPEILAQAIRNEYEAITGEKYEDEVQMSMDNTIADIVGHYKLDGPDFMAAWDKVVKESVNEGSDQQRLTHLRKFGIAPNNQPQNAAYIKQVSKPGKFFVDWKDAFKLGDVALEFIKSVGSISEFDIIDLKTMKRTGKQLDVKKGQLGNLRTTYGVRVNESVQLDENVNEAEKYITDEFKVGDKIKTNFGEWEVIEIDYAPKKSFIAPFIFKGKDMKRVNIPNPPKTNKNAVGYKVTDGAKYPTTGFLYQYKDITKLATVGVDESVVTEAATDRFLQSAARNLAKQMRGKSASRTTLMNRLNSMPLANRLKPDELEKIIDYAMQEMGLNESYKGNFSDFKYDLEMAIDNMDISPKSIKSVKKKGKGYEVRLSSYMSDKSTWEKIGDTIGATLISFKPGSINIGIYE